MSVSTPIDPSAAALIVHGARGRMGARILHLATQDPRFKHVTPITHETACPPPSVSSIPEETSIVIVDFSSDQGARSAARIAGQINAALLVGTTGLSPETLELIDHLADSHPVMVAPNTSLGAAVLDVVTHTAATLLSSDFEPCIIESHHRDKRDAPSGTAAHLARTIDRARGRNTHHTDIHSIRAADTIGEHEIRFIGPEEKILFLHACTGRNVFARGALHAAHWLTRQPPARYTIKDCLFAGLSPILSATPASVH